MRATTPALALAACLVVLPFVARACCACPSMQPELETFETGHSLTGEGTGRYYVDNDLCQPECAYSVWIYEESNGIPGLQRQDHIQDDTCGGLIPGDTLVL